MEQKWIGRGFHSISSLCRMLGALPATLVIVCWPEKTSTALWVRWMVSFWSKSNRMSVWSFVTKNNPTRSFWPIVYFCAHIDKSDNKYQESRRRGIERPPRVFRTGAKRGRFLDKQAGRAAVTDKRWHRHTAFAWRARVQAAKNRHCLQPTSQSSSPYESLWEPTRSEPSEKPLPDNIIDSKLSI